MTAKQLFQAGQLNEALKALAAEVRDNPTDRQRRTFLFELLCFAGEYDRAEKHLHVLAQGGGNAEMGAVLYFSALHAERTRLQKFNGVPAETFYLHLKECEWRFNHRRDNLYLELLRLLRHYPL